MEYVWIVGVSRVGKATLMRALAADAAVRTALGLGTVEIFARSLDLRRDLDPHDIIPATRAEHLLIKWQERDRQQRVVERLLEVRRDERHSFIVLQRHPLQILANWTNSARPYLGSLSAELKLIETIIDEWRNRIPVKFVWAEAGTYAIERGLRQYNPTWIRILTPWADYICRWRDRLKSRS